MSRPALLGIGGHVVGALLEQLGAVPGLAAAVERHLVPEAPGGRPRMAAEVVGRAAVVLAEAGALQPEERAALPAGCAVVTLPRLVFESLWPLAAEHPPRNGLPAVPAPFGDRIALQVLRSATPPAGRRAAYDTVKLESLADLGRMHAFVAREMFRREEGCDIRLAGFVLARFRRERLFHSPVHPAAPLLAVVMAQLLGHPAIAALGEGSHDAQLRAVLPGLEAVFAECQAPIHPAVADHFGLDWWSPELRYRQGAEVRSFGEWVDWHLRSPPAAPPAGPAPLPVSRAAPLPPPLPPPLAVPASGHATRVSVGPGLAELRAAGGVAQVAELHPATAVARTAPFFATAIDPDIAPRGAALLRPEAGRYALPACLAVRLDEAIVLGDSGAVLHGGKAVADTLPHPLPSAPDMPPRRRIEAPSLLGFGPLWAEDPHGMLGLLPRLVAAARLRRQEPALRVLLPRATRATWLEEMLALLSLGAAVDWLGSEPAACAGLVVTGRLGHEEVSPLARQAARALAGLVAMSPPGPRRLYLRSARAAASVRNEAQVAAALAAQGFTLVDADQTPLPRRIALLRHATAVVAAQGGALAEMAFCPDGAAVLELLGPADPSPLYWSLASVCGLRYGYVVGEAAGAAAPGGPYTVPLAMLEQAAALLPA